MARFHGKVGYGVPVEESPGVFVDAITEREYFGDVFRNTRQLNGGENLNPDLTVANTISVVVDAYAREHFFNIRYVEWSGELWIVTAVEVQAPRLVLSLGEVYNGPTAESP